MVGWHHGLDQREFERVPGVGDGQGSLGCCSPWGCKELEASEKILSPELRFQISGFQNFKTVNFCCLSHSVCGTFYHSPGKEHT